MPPRRALTARSSAGRQAPHLGRAPPLSQQRLLAALRRRPGPGAPRGASHGLLGSEPSPGSEKGRGGGRGGRRGPEASGGTPSQRGDRRCAPVPGEKCGGRRGPGRRRGPAGLPCPTRTATLTLWAEWICRLKPPCTRPSRDPPLGLSAHPGRVLLQGAQAVRPGLALKRELRLRAPLWEKGSEQCESGSNQGVGLGGQEGALLGVLLFCLSRVWMHEGETAAEEGSLVPSTRYSSTSGAAEELRQRLTRKQWKNRQKNKRQQKNKFKAVVGLGSREPSDSRPLVPSVAEDPPDDQRGLVPDTEAPGRQTPSLRQCPARQETSCSKSLAFSTVEDPPDDQEGLILVTEAPGRRTTSLRQRLESRLDAARFRYINQQLYTRSSREAAQLFQEDPEALAVYHRGFALQAACWPEQPVERFVRYLRHRPASLVVADFGCGDCTLARSIPNQVHCFDLVALDPRVTVCDMAQVPLEGASVDVAVFCLALMGTNLREILQEAHRVLRTRGTLLVAEVASRFADVRAFLGALARLGFRLVSKDLSGSHFYVFELRKAEKAAASAEEEPRGLALRPCLYKRR
ncbi:ribosomal RNA-processing protein 8 isoform X1 [Candoia aspera]|uniref:ribosomal RNA-processing protein 8 isoform X1 n=1 Tax=Candoia aspera TaxID=51853 RepID=UPI002FD7EC75